MQRAEQAGEGEVEGSVSSSGRERPDCCGGSKKENRKAGHRPGRALSSPLFYPFFSLVSYPSLGGTADRGSVAIPDYGLAHRVQPWAADERPGERGTTGGKRGKTLRCAPPADEGGGETSSHNRRNRNLPCLRGISGIFSVQFLILNDPDLASRNPAGPGSDRTFLRDCSPLASGDG